MKLDSFLLCDSADAMGGKLFILGGGITRLVLPSLPGGVPLMAVVARFRFEDDEPLGTHGFKLRLLAPTDPGPPVEVVGEIGGEWKPGLEGEERYANLVLAVGPVRFAQAGIYRIQLWVDQRLTREMALPVAAASGEPGES